MKLIYFVCVLFFHLFSQASGFVDVLPLQSQWRYEDSLDQTKTNQFYRSYTLAVQYDEYRLGLEDSHYYAQTGNSSLRIEKKIQEYLLTAGYEVFRLSHDRHNIFVSAFVNGLLGTTQTKVTTTLLGLSSQDSSDQDLVIGTGASAVGRFHFLMAELETKILTSKNMNPQVVPAGSIKFGLFLAY